MIGMIDMIDSIGLKVLNKGSVDASLQQICKTNGNPAYFFYVEVRQMSIVSLSFFGFAWELEQG